jgi:hypothetical protein
MMPADAPKPYQDPVFVVVAAGMAVLFALLVYGIVSQLA